MAKVHSLSESNPYIVVTDPALFPETEARKAGKDTIYKVLDTYKNLEWLLRYFRATVRYNKMTRRREVEIPNHGISSEDSENSALARVDYLATLNLMPRQNLDSHLNQIAWENAYHPITEMIERNPWDGVKRLHNFCATIHSPLGHVAEAIIRTWMVAAVSAAFTEKGFINQGVLVLQGSQGIGKTSWLKKLDPLGCDAVKEGAFLDPSNKDSVIQIASFWIVELGELETIFKKSEIGRLKSYLTMEADHVRLPYAKKITRLLRRTVYAATVNDFHFLGDDTGNRRWWTIPVDKIDDHNMDMIQVWAEVYELYKQGHPAVLEKAIQKEVNENNAEHEKIDSIEEELTTNYDWLAPARRETTATELLKEIGYKNPGKGECMRMANILYKLTGKKSRKSGSKRLHNVPFKLTKCYQGN